MNQRVRLGLTIGRERVVAVETRIRPSGAVLGRIRECSIARPAADGAWPELVEALRKVMSEFGARTGVVSVALLRPLAQAKVIEVPPVRRSQLSLLVARNAHRYFLGSAKRLIAEAVPVPTPAAPRSRALAVCADEPLLETICASIQEVGLRVELVTAAPIALAEVLTRWLPRVQPTSLAVAICSAHWMEGIVMQRGVLQLVESWRGRSTEEVADLVGSMSSSTTKEVDGADSSDRAVVVLAGSRERNEMVAASVRGAGQTVLEGLDQCDAEPEVLAAFGAAAVPASVPLLLPRGVRRSQDRRKRHLAGGLAAVAAFLVALSATLHLWAAQRELASVVRERHAIAPQVARALELRNGARAVQANVEALSDIDSSSVRWTAVLATLAETLPKSAYLVSLSADGAQLRLAGSATSASTVVPALQVSPMFQDVLLISTQRQQSSNTAQRFDLTLKVDGGASQQRAPQLREQTP